MQAGSKLHLQHAQVNEGVELALLFLDAMFSDSAQVNQEHLQLVAELVESFPNLATSSGAEPLNEEQHQKVEQLSRIVGAAGKWAYKYVPFGLTL